MLLLVLGPAGARAAPPTGDFTIAPDPPNQGQAATFTCEPCPSSEDVTVTWDITGDSSLLSGRQVTHTYLTAGAKTVRMRLFQLGKGASITTRTFTVNASPDVDLNFEPVSPVPGEEVAFGPEVSDPDGDAIVALAWTFGDGESGFGSEPVHSYDDPGTYTVSLTAVDARGASRTQTRQLVVRVDPGPSEAVVPGAPAVEDPGSSPTVPSGTGPAKRIRPMKPFPIVRIAGTVLPRGASVRILSVRSPRGSRIRVRCSGRGCPVGAVARTSATSTVRFPQFERRLRAGIRLEVFVRQQDRIGKYTSFLIRAGAPPERVDRCLFPGRRGPARCP